MDYITVVGLALLVFISYVVGKLSASGDMKNIKRENEQLNKQLHVLTDRDKRGRFKGGK
jgi:hypothetical protein